MKESKAYVKKYKFEPKNQITWTLQYGHFVHVFNTVEWKFIFDFKFRNKGSFGKVGRQCLGQE